MVKDDGAGEARDLLAYLRDGTSASHARLDSLFGALDLAHAPGLARYLGAHAIAVNALHGAFAAFVNRELGMACPDYPEMLRRDLAALGAAALPALPDTAPLPDLSDEAAAFGLGYVLAGSRLGNAVIRRGGYAGRDSGSPSLYMEDDSGHEVWKALVPLLRSCPPDQTALDSALATFETFERAIAVSAVSDTLSPQEADG